MEEVPPQAPLQERPYDGYTQVLASSPRDHSRRRWRVHLRRRLVPSLEAAHACHHPQWICRLEALAGPGVECYADAPGEMQAHGFQVVETAQIAQLLAQADMVITL